MISFKQLAEFFSDFPVMVEGFIERADKALAFLMLIFALAGFIYGFGFFPESYSVVGKRLLWGLVFALGFAVIIGLIRAFAVFIGFLVVAVVLLGPPVLIIYLVVKAVIWFLTLPTWW